MCKLRVSFWKHRAVFSATNQKEVYIVIRQWEITIKISKLLEARENANEKVAIVFSFASDWLGGERKFSGPITWQNKEELDQSLITFDIQSSYFSDSII